MMNNYEISENYIIISAHFYRQILGVLSQSTNTTPVVFRYKFNFEISMFTKWGAVYKPSLDKVNSELHQAYPITGSDSINIENGRDRTRTVPVVDPFDCIVS